jgi:hypothetical protein
VTLNITTRVKSRVAGLYFPFFSTPISLRQELGHSLYQPPTRLPTPEVRRARYPHHLQPISSPFCGAILTVLTFITLFLMLHLTLAPAPITVVGTNSQLS